MYSASYYFVVGNPLIMTVMVRMIYRVSYQILWMKQSHRTTTSVKGKQWLNYEYRIQHECLSHIYYL